MEITLDDTLVQTRIVPQIRCENRCNGDTCMKDQRYSVFRAPKFLFVTLETGSASGMDPQILQPLQMKSNLISTCFSYRLNCFIIITKDGRTFIIQPEPNSGYVAYNHVTKVYEPLFGYHFDDFIAAAAADIVLCYESKDDTDATLALATSPLDFDS